MNPVKNNIGRDESRYKLEGFYSFGIMGYYQNRYIFPVSSSRRGL